jgi:chromosomal replication initiator protein
MALRKPITRELAEPALADFCRQHTPQVKLSDIQRAVCDVFAVESSSLKSGRKTRAVAEPRMLAMWLARRYTRAALSEIGDFFGRRSHSTVVSAQKKFDKLISEHGEMVVGDQLCTVEEAIRRIEAKLRTA